MPACVPGLRGLDGVHKAVTATPNKKLLSKYVPVCSGFGGTIGYWRSEAKSWSWCGG